MRLGKQVTRNNPRPVKIELEGEQNKFRILKKAANIRKTEIGKVNKIIITTDMTIRERELNKILREELKTRREAGENNIKIRNGRIVQSEPTDE